MILKGLIITWGRSASGTSGSLSSQAQSGNKQVLPSHGPGCIPSSGLHVLDLTEQIKPNKTNPMIIRAMAKTKN